MGKKLRQQRRGKGSLRYRSPGHRFMGKIKYSQKQNVEGQVVDIVKDPARKCPVSVVSFGAETENMISPKGIKVGDKIGYVDSVKLGNVSRLEKIPEGTQICNIELRPNDGGSLCRNPGTYATIIGHERGKCVISLPSKAMKKIPDSCRATIGVVAGSGFKAKPFMKAGKKFHVMHARNKYWPMVSAVSKNPVDHPFGGNTKPGIPKSISRHAPPGAKVGSISSRRTGKRK